MRCARGPCNAVGAALDRLSADPDVEWAEPDYRVHALRAPADLDLTYDPSVGVRRQWGTDRVNATAAWDVTTGDAAVKARPG